MTSNTATSQAIRRNHGWEHDLGNPHATREALAATVVADIATHGPARVVALAISHADCEDLADRIRSGLQTAGQIHGPELAGPAWHHGERRYATGDRILVHGTLHTHGQRLHNGSVLTVTAVAHDGLRAIDDHGTGLTLPRTFAQGRRSDGSPNCSHAWARTVDGIQGGTWPQIHLLGTATLQRFTGYTAQSRGRHATHTWNVTRLPDIDHGGVLADQRSPEREVLDALRRQPDTGFAVHDAPSHIEALLAEQAALRDTLNHRPLDQRPALRQAELALTSAHTDLYWANHRLKAAEQRLGELGPLSQLRRHGRNDRTTVLDEIGRFTDDIQQAKTKIAGYQRDVDKLRSTVNQRQEWDTEHAWPDSRLHTVDTELAELGHSGLHIGGTTRDRGLPGHSLAREPEWLHRLPEVARSPLPGPDHGIDLGL